jgi:hypothetical protein
MGELVVIMEICPCPGYLEPLHGCHLQQAEYHVLAKRVWKFYHEHAVKIGEWPNPVLAYRRIDAELLLEWLTEKRPYARYWLWTYPLSAAPGAYFERLS